MKTSNRLEQAINKLYVAFHKNTLHPECCKQCAVGNILDHTDSWKHLSDYHGSTKLNYVGIVHQNLGRKFNGYTPLELLQIEAVFLEACGYQLPLHFKNKIPKNALNKDCLFDGLSAVVRLLYKFDGMPCPLDYDIIFNYQKNNQQIKQNQSV